jgi:ArsR family transcriptional regulator, lead/cadmium/zinc/bismuth-responsive transcriptional repressor
MPDRDTWELLCLDLPRAEALRRSRPGTDVALRVAELGSALADPTRVEIALALREGGELCVCEVSWVCERSDTLVSHHVRALRTAGLVSSRRGGKMVMYELTAAGLALLSAVSAPVEAAR